jgi:hypothetical protein
LLNIIDPADFGLSTDDLKDYSQIRAYQAESIVELQSIARRFKSMGYEVTTRVEIGSYDQMVDREAADDKTDLLVLIRRRTLKRRIEKEREDSAMAILSKYPGKIMIVRRARAK